MPGYANPQSLNRYGYVINNPLRYTDPTGHRMLENEYGGGCSTTGYCPASSNTTNTTGNGNNNDDYETDGGNNNDSDHDANNTEPSNGGYSNPELDALYLDWEKIVMPFNDILSAEDIYRMTSRGGWRASRSALNLGILEAIAQGGRQAYRDSWYQTLTPSQRILRPIVVGAEALATDGISGAVGNGYAVASFMVGGPPGAFGRKLAGATYATHVMDRFWMDSFNPNVLDPLGAWP